MHQAKNTHQIAGIKVTSGAMKTRKTPIIPPLPVSHILPIFLASGIHHTQIHISHMHAAAVARTKRWRVPFVTSCHRSSCPLDHISNPTASHSLNNLVDAARPLPATEPCDAKPTPRRELPVVSAHHSFQEWDDDALGE